MARVAEEARGVAPLPVVLWTVPDACVWTDLAARGPHRPLARVLVGALAGGGRG